LRGKQMTFGQFIWNGETSECFGRTGTSWAKIFIFYCTYYLFLAGFFSLCMFLFYQTLDTVNMPKYSPGAEDSILKNPSLGYRPRPPSNNIESSMIRYSSEKPKTYEHWAESIDALIEGREETKKIRDYSKAQSGDNIISCNATTHPKEGTDEVCNYDVSFLGEECKSDKSWGYTSDSPCIVLKLNRMIGWTPKVYETLKELPKEMPKTLKDHIKKETEANNNVVPKMLWVSCDGESPMDREMLGSLDETSGVKYFPQPGFPDYFFPYNNQANYKSPLIAVRFHKPRPNILIHVSCTLYAKDITYSNKDAIGLVRMQLLLDEA